jgi:dipeptidyl aminopeptidase/acylaminoacyl peptidase
VKPESSETGIAWADYVRAERFLPWNATRLAFELDVEPNWIGETDRFWYRAQRRSGTDFIIVDPTTGSSAPAFDHVRLAAALSRASGVPADPNDLPFTEITVTEDDTIQFTIEASTWTCSLETYELTSTPGEDAPAPDVVRSPDGKWDAFTRENNLWLRSVESGKERQLTTDGIENYAFGSPLPSPLASSGIADPDGPAAIWSPDSSRLLSCRIDARDALQLHLVQSVPKDGSLRPRLHSYAYPLPGDEQIPQAELWTFDVATGAATKAELDPIGMLYYGSPLNANMVWWTSGGSSVFVLTRDRGYLSYRLHEVNADTGKTREIIVETAERGIEPFLLWASVNVRIIDDGREILWYSQRDGWAHLYLYDGVTGELKRQLTSGAFNISEVIRINEKARVLFFAAVGREPGGDPYYTKIYRVSLDGGEPQLLTPEEAEHGAIFSPSGRFFVNTYSRHDLPPITVLRDEFGTEITRLVAADIEPLVATGWRFPERFTAKARDGVTDIYGVIFRPTNFDADTDYPVIDNIYAGPQVNQAPTSFADSKRVGGSTRAGRGKGFWHAQAIAELGFVVVMIDGLGMPARSRAYHDVTYRDLGDGGIEDHIVALQQLKDRYPYLDLDRVGIFGHSAGGYASAHAILTFPDFYKVCVSSAGNHDHRLDKASWVERYMGLPVEDHYRQQANQTLAANLKGKLLLIHGEMDENVHPSSTLVVVDALIKENKDFDLLIIPNQPHASDHNPYFVRRRWDYFVRHLRGEDPPVGYAIRGPQ